jgi:alkylhydroperoxidase family enzyme
VAAHAADLRVEVDREQARGRDTGGSGGGDPAAPAGGLTAEAFVADIAAQGSEAAPTPRLRALLQFAERLALAPGAFEESHLEPLRAAGLDDRAIHDATQVVAYFSYINRIADGLGVDLEPEMQ